MKRIFNFTIGKADLQKSDFEEYIFTISDFSKLSHDEITLIFHKISSEKHTKDLLIYIFMNSNNQKLIKESMKKIDFGIDLGRTLSLCKTLSYEYDFNIDFLEKDGTYHSKSSIIKGGNEIFNYEYKNTINLQYKNKWIKSMQHKVQRMIINELKKHILESSQISK